MAYLSSTEASSVANPPVLVLPKPMGNLPGTTSLSTGNGRNVYQEQGGALWMYRSSHGSTELMDSGFFSDAKDIGMRPGDMMMYHQWTTEGSSQVCGVGVIGDVSTAGAALSTGGTITSTYS